MGKLVIDGNSIYEIDEECIRRKERQERGEEQGDRKNKKAEWRQTKRGR